MRDVWEAMSDKTRREILAMLKERDLSAGEIAERFNLTKATVSHHLSVLKSARLVDTEKRAQTIIYSLNMTVFQSFLLTVNNFFADKNFKGSTQAKAEESPSVRSFAERTPAAQAADFAKGGGSGGISSPNSAASSGAALSPNFAASSEFGSLDGSTGVELALPEGMKP